LSLDADTPSNFYLSSSSDQKTANDGSTSQKPLDLDSISRQGLQSLNIQSSGMKDDPGLVEARIKTTVSSSIGPMSRSAELGAEIPLGVPFSLPGSSRSSPHPYLPNTVGLSPVFDEPPSDHATTSSTKPADLPRSRSSLPKSETRHSFQRRFNGTRHSPRSVKWVSQRIQEDKYESSQAALANWVHKKRQIEVSRVTIEELNQLSNNNVIEALQELRKPKRYVQGSGG
jgi:hypothetical protein